MGGTWDHPQGRVGDDNMCIYMQWKRWMKRIFPFFWCFHGTVDISDQFEDCIWFAGSTLERLFVMQRMIHTGLISWLGLKPSKSWSCLNLNTLVSVWSQLRQSRLHTTSEFKFKSNCLESHHWKSFPLKINKIKLTKTVFCCLSAVSSGFVETNTQLTDLDVTVLQRFLQDGNDWPCLLL